MTDHTTPEPERIDALLTIEEVVKLLRMPVATIRHLLARARHRAARVHYRAPAALHPPGRPRLARRAA